MVGELGAGRGLARALQSHHHDNVGSALHWHVGLDTRVHQLDELGEDRLLYELPLVVALRHLLEVNTGADILTQGFHWTIQMKLTSLDESVLMMVLVMVKGKNPSFSIQPNFILTSASSKAEHTSLRRELRTSSLIIVALLRL